MNRMMMFFEDLADIESLFEFCQTVFICALLAAVAAAVLTAAIVPINLLLRRWLSSGQLCLLWGLVLVRLLLPVAPTSAFSLQNIRLQSPFATSTKVTDRATASTQVAYDVHTSTTWTPAHANPDAVESAAVRNSVTVADVAEYAVAVFFYVWLVGTIVFALWTAIVQWRFSRKVNRAMHCHDSRLLDLWHDCQQLAGVRNTIPILLFDGVQQPAVMGLFHPRLLLPTELAQLESRQLKMIMLHELAHIKRWDIAANYCLMLIRALHWWNPVYWLAASRYQSLREQACDNRALAWFGDDVRTDYGELLLTLAQRQSAGLGWRVMLPASMLGMISSYFQKRSIRSRLRAIGSGVRKPSRLQVVGVAIAFIGLFVCGFTDASEEEVTRPTRTTPWPNGANFSFDMPKAVVEGPTENRVYALAKVMARLKEQGYREKDAIHEIKMHLSRFQIDVWRAELRQREISPELTKATPQPRPVPAPAKETKTETNTKADKLLTKALAAMEINENKLLVKAPKSVHDQIANQLAIWEYSGFGMITTEVRMIDSQVDIASQAGVNWQQLQTTPRDQGVKQAVAIPDPNGGPTIQATSYVEEYLPVVVAKLSEEQIKQFVNKAQSDERTNLLFAPKITQFNGQQASILSQSERPYVSTFHSKEAGKPKHTVEFAVDGISLSILPLFSPDHKAIDLSVTLNINKVIEMPTVTSVLTQSETDDEGRIGVETAQPIQVQQPRTRRQRIQVQDEVAKSEHLLIGCLPTRERKEYLYLLISPHEVEIEKEELLDD